MKSGKSKTKMTVFLQGPEEGEYSCPMVAVPTECWTWSMGTKFVAVAKADAMYSEVKEALHFSTDDLQLVPV